MCGVAGIIDLKNRPVQDLEHKLAVMNQLIAHRGPDGEGIWAHDSQHVGLAHRRLSIIDLSENGAQPMHGANKSVVTFNGEIYNYPELQTSLNEWPWRSKTDTECILAAYEKYGTDSLDYLKGMFAFALWDEQERSLFCGRDRFGIKPFYYLVQDDVFYFASEVKALMPFIHDIATDETALAEYVVFQHSIGTNTLFKNVKKLLPGEALKITNGHIKTWTYWDVSYELDTMHSEAYFKTRLDELMHESMKLHLRSDVPIGSYLSGGIDSSLMAAMAHTDNPQNRKCFHGKFTDHPGYDESEYARTLAEQHDLDLYEKVITADEFATHIHDIIYMLDFPVAGPGSFPQYMTSKLASEHVKVVLGGQGGDEIFGGYARYLIGYLEQCLKAGINGTYKNGHFLVTLESIIPNLGLLREYTPLLKKFWSQGLFEEMDQRYYHLINRSADMDGEMDTSNLNLDKVWHDFSAIFNDRKKIQKEAYFDSMTRFDFKCMLPALLHVEDRMSMAHGIEARVPFLYHPLIEFMATVPAAFKFPGGQMKYLLKETFKNYLPSKITQRRDKMGFPAPFKEWFGGPLQGFIEDTFNTKKAQQRDLMDTDLILQNYNQAGQFSRKLWGLLSLELWHQNFHDKAAHFRKMV